MALTIYGGHVTSRFIGGGPAFAIGRLLSLRDQSFGAGLTEIDVTLVHLPLRGGILPDRVDASGVFPRAPSRRYETARKRLTVNWIGHHLKGRRGSLMLLPWFSRARFDLAFDDLIDAIEYGLPTIKPDVPLDRAGLLNWLRQVRSEDFGTTLRLMATLRRNDRDWQKRQEDMDPWAKLDIDWTKVPAAARALLDDPRDWSGDDEFSPHGSDTGADIWAEWSRFAKMTPERATRALEMDIPSGPDDKEHIWWHWVEVHLALAFGHIKKVGTCPDPLRQQTLDVIRAERLRAAPLSDWKHRDDWLDRLTRYETILGKPA